MRNKISTSSRSSLAFVNAICWSKTELFVLFRSFFQATCFIWCFCAIWNGIPVMYAVPSFDMFVKQEIWENDKSQMHDSHWYLQVGLWIFWIFSTYIKLYLWFKFFTLRLRLEKISRFIFHSCEHHRCLVDLRNESCRIPSCAHNFFIRVFQFDK